MEDLLKYLIAFILGWIIARMTGEGFSVGGIANNYNQYCNYTPGVDGYSYTCSTKGECPLVCVSDPSIKGIGPHGVDGVCKFDWGQGDAANKQGPFSDIACTSFLSLNITIPPIPPLKVAASAGGGTLEANIATSNVL